MARFVIGHVAFATKQAATTEVRRILNTAEIDIPLEDRDGSLIAALYSLHPRKEAGPVAFCVGTNNYHGALTRGFQAIYPDGSRKPFSYIPCLSPATDAPDVLKAMRAAIMLSQREALRAAYAGRVLLPCHACKAGLTIDVAHVHHLPPKFRDIAGAFIGLVGLPVVETSSELGDDFVSVPLKRRWVLFHDAVAQRVVLCATCNAADERDNPE